MSSSTASTAQPSLPADLIAGPDEAAFASYEKILLDIPTYVPLDPNLPPYYHAGVIDKEVAKTFWSTNASGTELYHALLRNTTDGRPIQMSGIDFAQYRSEVESDRGTDDTDLKVCVKGILRVRARDAADPTHVLVHVPAWAKGGHVNPDAVLYPAGLDQKGRGVDGICGVYGVR